MAKAPPPKGGSKIRFIMLEADLSEGDLDQVTQAIQNAIRPPASPQYQRVITVQAPATGALEAPTAENETIESVEEELPSQPARASRVKSDRRPRSPDVLDLDLLTGPVPWAEFAAEKAPQTEADRYLTVAAWFKTHRSMPAITYDHVYTCFKAVKWSTSNPDFGLPLRSLKARKFMGNPSKGHYAINHLGVARVDELPKGQA